MKKHFPKLSVFERCLWVFSTVIIIISYMIPTSKDYITLIASLIGVSALIFLAKGHYIGQVLTIIFCIIYGFISFFFQYYGELLTYLCMTLPMAAIALASWIKNPYLDSHEVEIKNLKTWQVILVFVLSIIVTCIFYFILKYFNTTNLGFSTLSVTTSFIAASFSYLRSPYYALGYMANDIVLIVLWILASITTPTYLPMVACFTMFLLNDLYGFINWQRMKKRQTN